MKLERRAPVIVALAIVVVSFAAILIRLCTIPTALIAAYRLGFSSLILLPFFTWKGRGCGVGLRRVGLCFVAGVFLALHFLFWIESLKLTTVASSVMLVTTSPGGWIWARRISGATSSQSWVRPASGPSL